MLQFFSDSGVIVSFKERIDKLGIAGEVMDDTVIRPKWLIKSLAGFLFDDIHQENVRAVKNLKGRNMVTWAKLHQRGILSRSLFEKLMENLQ